MGVAVKQHIMQVVDWSKYSLEGWLKQFGLWCGEGDNASRMIIKDRSTKRMSQKERERLIAEYMTDGEMVRNQFKKTHSCLIDDNEARAVQKLWNDVSDHESEVLHEWFKVVWQYHVKQKSIRQISETTGLGRTAVHEALKCGLAHIAGRNPHLKCDLLLKA